MSVVLTASERKTLAALQEHGAMCASAVGHLLWEQSDPLTRKRNPSPQGLALLAGRFLGRLSKRLLVAPQRRGWAITTAGYAELVKGGAA